MLGSCWKDGDTIKLVTSMDPVTAGCLICLWMSPGFARESSPPSPCPLDCRGKLGLYSMIRVPDLVRGPAWAVIKLRTTWHTILVCVIHVSYSPFSHLLIILLLCLFLHPRLLANKQPPLIIFSSFDPVLPHLYQILHLWYWYLGNTAFIWCSWIW